VEASATAVGDPLLLWPEYININPPRSKYRVHPCEMIRGLFALSRLHFAFGSGAVARGSPSRS